MSSCRGWCGLAAVAAAAVMAVSAPITCVGAEPTIAASSSSSSSAAAAAGSSGLFESAKAALECQVCKVRGPVWAADRHWHWLTVCCFLVVVDSVVPLGR